MTATTTAGAAPAAGAAERDIEIEQLGETAVLVRFGDAVSAELARRAQRFARFAREARIAAVLDVVPAFASCALYFDIDALRDDESPEQIVEATLAAFLGAPASRTTWPGRLVELPVAYGGESGPDLDAFARSVGLGRDDVIARHAAPEYVVGMVGFLPGFPYLIGLDPKLALPRHATPRPRVPAGSVAIGGAQTGIYPCASPGGWHLLGRCSARLFDPARAEPALLRAGDRVRFRPVTASELAKARVEVHT
ncbi:MAG TPA: 5-oxoprolinase subunit PxpB [Xanthomonadales bacterium]|nr:5-oxoprolinase subunit PxpB [Xanthomonadales bacterium]